MLKNYVRSKTRLPDWADAPELPPHLEFYLIAFFELTRDRQSGMGVGAIPYMTMFTYAQVHGLSGEETDEFTYMLSAMDSEFLAYHREESERKARQAK